MESPEVSLLKPPSHPFPPETIGMVAVVVFLVVAWCRRVCSRASSSSPPSPPFPPPASSSALAFPLSSSSPSIAKGRRWEEMTERRPSSYGGTSDMFVSLSHTHSLLLLPSPSRRTSSFAAALLPVCLRLFLSRAVSGAVPPRVWRKEIRRRRRRRKGFESLNNPGIESLNIKTLNYEYS